MIDMGTSRDNKWLKPCFAPDGNLECFGTAKDCCDKWNCCFRETVYPGLNLKERRSVPLNRFRRNKGGDELTGFHQFRALPKGMKLRIVLKYGLFQMIGVTILLLVLPVLRQWVNLSPMFVWGSVGLWIIKDIILFAFVWRAYEWKGSKDVHALIGTQGVVIERLAPSGYIRIHGELWHAETMKEAVDIQENVRVQGNHGLTLLVQPCYQKHIQ